MTDASEHERRYLIIVRADRSVETVRVITFIKEKLERMSRGRSHLAFSSADGSVVGIFLKIAKPAAVVRAAIDGASTANDREFVMVLELGEEFSAMGNSAAWRWLQHD